MEKTVWVINQFAGTPESGSGERHFYFSKYWREQGFDVKIISGSYNHMFRNNVDVKGVYEHTTYEGVDFIWVNTPKYNPRSIKRFWSMMVFAFRIFQLPLSITGKPQAIIVSSMPIFPIYTGWRLAKKYGAKLLFEIRDIWPLSLQLLGNKSKYHPAVQFIGWFEKFGYRKSHHTISLLPNAQEHFEQVAKKKVDFHYIPNGIDESQLKEEPLDKELEVQIPKNKFIVGYAGTFGLANALEFLVDACTLMQDNSEIFFVLVGDGYLKEELINKTRNQSNILFLPKIPKNQVQSLLRHFDVCYVGRNGSELFKHGVSANKYFDYMLAAKPILDSNNKIKDPVELSGGGIIVKPDSAEAVQIGVNQLFQMTAEKRREMGIKGNEYVRKFHSIPNLAKQYSILF